MPHKPLVNSSNPLAATVKAILKRESRVIAFEINVPKNAYFSMLLNTGEMHQDSRFSNLIGKTR
jgi:hypothetical protein